MFPEAGCDRVLLRASRAGTYSGPVQLKQSTWGAACDAPVKCTLRVNVNGVLAPAEAAQFRPLARASSERFKSYLRRSLDNSSS